MRKRTMISVGLLVGLGFFFFQWKNNWQSHKKVKDLRIKNEKIIEQPANAVGLLPEKINENRIFDFPPKDQKKAKVDIGLRREEEKPKAKLIENFKPERRVIDHPRFGLTVQLVYPRGEIRYELVGPDDNEATHEFEDEVDGNDQVL